ncbi:helix-turn-helix domain-containing protein [Bordetella hinzii]|uniref:helix-turn-helix domain-containing protein n=1 Tax=Bordetella hinzii TaxID=103855 RepID=UPI000459ECDF|nr:helix-turn-helix domain-containing protein [Bordetella hinzii]KCB31421.1 hypothetical protein L541_2575 [Bordetella hinzii CA90 BAL1384]QDJ42435.1 helix-turn-helix domain-containing protein [Bordetella hinzii]QDJ47003.1 helix-turn-helix domain-containing protein [Bordetella hinzii]QDJ55913.1 helix-turn-helix domain-containing protein [Bordetella hinzii]QWF37872.1 helix-turn-helix domain-containing protein [Bordetella hinzii]
MRDSTDWVASRLVPALRQLQEALEVLEQTISALGGPEMAGRPVALGPEASRLQLTLAESRVFEYMRDRARQAVPPVEIYFAAGNHLAPSSEAAMLGVVRVLISRMRRKCLKAGVLFPIVAIRGMGYMFDDRVA